MPQSERLVAGIARRGGEGAAVAIGFEVAFYTRFNVFPEAIVNGQSKEVWLRFCKPLRTLQGRDVRTLQRFG